MSTSKSISSSSEDYTELRRGPWTLDEDALLTQFIANNGEGRWNLLAKSSGLRRTGKSCRLRWLNYLKPDVKRGNLTPEEQFLILELHSKWGNRWSKIAQSLPGRTDNEIKNYWRTRVQKQARHLKIDPNSREFHEIVRCFWVPRLLQKAKEPPSSTMSVQNQAIPLPPGRVSQYGATGTPPTQIPWQGPSMNEGVLNYLNQHQQNSDSEHNNSSCLSSTESTNIADVPQLLGYTASQSYAVDNSDFSTFSYDGYVNINANDMEAFNLATTGRAGEGMEYTVGDCQMAESNWATNDFASSMRNMDELWQLRNLK